MKCESNNLSLQEDFRVKPLAFAILLAFSGNTQAATYNVTSLADTGAGSLREAVGFANANPGADNITFAPALTGQTIVLTGAGLSVSIGDVIISGPIAGDASSITINGGGNSRIIRSISSNLTLENMTLTGGVSYSTGGALYGLSANFTLNDSVVTGNTATGDGGGIFAYYGSVTLNRSVVSGNSTTGNFSEGGGISAYYDVTLNESTVSGNSTNGIGSEGGGIYTNQDVILNNSTVSGNSTSGVNSEGGGIYADGSVISNNSTITGNSTVAADSLGGGVFVRSNLTLVNSILSGNTGAGGNFAENSLYNTFTATNSIFGDAPGELTTVTASITNNNNPMLGPLQNNGGPTPTHLPLAGSPALDAGDNAGAPANDQRGAGFSRIYNGTIDIGAVERQAVNPPQLGPTAVPIFSFGGLLAMISAFLGFGWRQRFLSRKRKE